MPVSKHRLTEFIFLMSPLFCLWGSIWLPDEQRWSKTFREKQRLQFCLHGNIPTLPTAPIKSGHVSHHTAGRYLIPVRRSCLPTFGCCKSLLFPLHCPETVDLNHKAAKAVSLMHEHVKICSLKSTWIFHLYSENSWWIYIQYQRCNQHYGFLKAIETFVLIPGDIWSAVPKGGCAAWGWVLCLSNKAFIPGEVLFLSSKKNDTPIW